MDAQDLDQLVDSLKRCGAALRDEGIPYMLGGSLAAWARGGPVATKDLDIMLRRADADAALRALEGAGLRPERPPEAWLLKAWDGDVLVDLIFEPSGIEVDEALARAETLSVQAFDVPVMTLTDMLTTQLMAMDEHYMQYGKLLAIGRALRERIEWEVVRERTASSPFARAYFTLVEGLGILPAETPAARG